MSAVLGPYQVAGSLWHFVLSGDQKAAEKPLSALWHFLLLSYIRTEQNANPGRGSQVLINSGPALDTILMSVTERTF